MARAKPEPIKSVGLSFSEAVLASTIYVSRFSLSLESFTRPVTTTSHSETLDL